MRSCLVVCVTSEKAACRAAGQVANALRTRGVAVDLACGRDLAALDTYDAVVLGAPLCHGRWQRVVWRFLRRHRKALENKNVALFTSDACGGDQSGYDRAWHCTIKMLTRLGWLAPVRIEVFPDAATTSPQATCEIPQDVERWVNNLVVSMHLTDRGIPGQVK